MTVTHHIDEATVLAFAAGTLDESASVIVAAHLAMCDGCHSNVREAEKLGAVLLGNILQEEMSPASLDAMMERIESSAFDDGEDAAAHETDEKAHYNVPRPLARHMDWPLEEVPWRRVAPGISVCELSLSKAALGTLKLVRVAAAKKIPAHGHKGSEKTLVLKGWFKDENGKFAAGDISEMDSDAEHTLVVGDEEDCICAVAIEGQMQFKGLVGRIMQPFVGI
ncbi:MAG: ChrR family anti-sigma-E factor [Hyphomicrobiales bacterium]